MELDNKGITLIEIIISVALISIVLIFLFSLLIQVNNENADNEIKSSYLVNQSTFIKQIEEDFFDYGGGFYSGESCNDTNISKTDINKDIYLPRLFGDAAVFEDENANIKCLKFTYIDNSHSYVFLYKRDEISTSDANDYKTILSYYRGDFKQSVELEEFDWNINNYDVYVKSETDNGMYAFSLPIVGPDGNDYSINLSYYKP